MKQLFIFAIAVSLMACSKKDSAPFTGVYSDSDIQVSTLEITKVQRNTTIGLVWQWKIDCTVDRAKVENVSGIEAVIPNLTTSLQTFSFTPPPRTYTWYGTDTSGRGNLRFTVVKTSGQRISLNPTYK